MSMEETFVDDSQEGAHGNGDYHHHGREALGLFLGRPVDLAQLGYGLGYKAEAT